MQPLTVAIDARLRHGHAGGVESVTVGLAVGLSGLEGDERYVFLTLRGHDDWIAPHLHGNVARAQVSDRRGDLLHRARPTLERFIPGVSAIGRRALRSQGPPLSDGTVEHAGVDVVHFVQQWGFRTDLPTIYHPHDLQHRHLPELFDPAQIAIRDKWYSMLSRQAAMVAVASSWTREDVIRELELPPEKVWVVPWAPPLEVHRVDLETRAAVDNLRLPSAFVLYPAQTWPHKNHTKLIEALAALRNSAGLSVPLVLSGARNVHARYVDAAIARCGLRDQIRWLGFIEPAELREVYRRATAVVIPSRFEAASGPLWEAFSAGVPVACSAVTSLPVQAGDAALLFDPEDADAIAAAIYQLWTDPQLRERLAQRGRKRVAAFSWDRTARTFRAHYRRIAGRLLTDEDRALIESPPQL